jgi:aspartyl-tRNA(Asn)/glutamyl-tRNA(Gln) amidotransferase subunit B
VLHVQSWVDAIVLPELPDARRERFIAQYGCSLNHARTLTGDLRLANFYENVVSPDPAKLSAAAGTWIADTLIGELNYRNMSIDEVDPSAFTAVLELLHGGVITDKSAIEVIRVILDQHLNHQPCETPAGIVDRLDLGKVSATGTHQSVSDGSTPGVNHNPIITAITVVLSEQPGARDDFGKGKKGAFNYLVGQVMKKTRGCADPGEVNRLLTEELTRKEA